MQRIEIPKGSKVTIEDGVILIEPAKLEPKVGEIVKICIGDYVCIGFYTNKRGDDVTTGLNHNSKLLINGIGIHDDFTLASAYEDDKTRLLTALSDAGYQYNEETHEVEKIRWKPKTREKYWSFRAAGVYNRINTLSDIDSFVIYNNFAFETETEAQEFFDQVKELAKKR